MCRSLVRQCMVERGPTECENEVVVFSLRCSRDEAYIPLDYIRPDVSVCPLSPDDVMMFKYAALRDTDHYQRVGCLVTCNKGYDAAALRPLTKSLHISQLYRSCENDFVFTTMGFVVEHGAYRL